MGIEKVPGGGCNPNKPVTNDEQTEDSSKLDKLRGSISTGVDGAGNPKDSHQLSINPKNPDATGAIAGGILGVQDMKDEMLASFGEKVNLGSLQVDEKNGTSFANGSNLLLQVFNNYQTVTGNEQEGFILMSPQKDSIFVNKELKCVDKQESWASWSGPKIKIKMSRDAQQKSSTLEFLEERKSSIDLPKVSENITSLGFSGYVKSLVFDQDKVTVTLQLPLPWGKGPSFMKEIPYSDL